MVQIPELIDGYRKCLDELGTYELIDISLIILKASHIYIAGNGGSASTASHFAADLRRIGLKAICLTDNISVVTALANDYSYSEVFSRQLDGITGEDILVVISASGNSPNIIKVAKLVKIRGALVIGFLGFGGGKAASIADSSIILSSKDYGEVEGIHSCLCHILPRIIKERQAIETKIRDVFPTT